MISKDSYDNMYNSEKRFLYVKQPTLANLRYLYTLYLT